MKVEYIIEAADNGMTVRAEEYFEVFENPTWTTTVIPRTMSAASSASCSMTQ